MNIYDKVMIVSFVWAVLFTICNPFLENKNLKMAAVGCLVVTTIAFLVRP